MSIDRRENLIAAPEGAVWRMWENKTETQWNFAVDNLTGTYNERKSWCVEQKFYYKNYIHMNEMVTFFKHEEDALMYYLRWGRHGNSTS